MLLSFVCFVLLIYSRPKVSLLCVFKRLISFDPSVPLSGNENFTYQITITLFKDSYPSFVNPKGGEGPYNGRRIIATNLSARPLHEIAYQFPTGIRTIMEVTDKSKFEGDRQNAICFDLIVPEDLAENRFNIMKQHLDIYCGYQSIIKERIRPVKILKQIEGNKKEIKMSQKGTDPFASLEGRGLSMKGSPIETLASFLEIQIDTAVLNETGLSGLFDLEIPWYNENPEQIHDELR